MNLKNIFRNTVIISAIQTLVLSPVLYADPIILPAKTDAIVFIPFMKIVSQLRSSISGQTMTLKENLPSYHLQSGDGLIQVDSDQVGLTAVVNTMSLQNTGSQNLNLTMQLNGATAIAYNLRLVVTVKKDLGFGWATLHLNMQCQQLKIGLQNQNPIRSGLSVENGLARISKIDWDLTSTAVTTELIGCNEVAGFDRELKAQIQNFIQQGFALEALKNLINSKINAAINNRISAEISKVLEAYNIKAEQKYIFDENNNLWVYPSSISSKPFTQADLTTLSRATTATMLINKLSVEELIKTNINQFLANKIISSTNYTALSKLTCSRFSQFFAWPALKSLSKCFDLQIQNRVHSVQLTNLNTLAINIKLGSWATGEGRNLAYFASQFSVSPLTSQTELQALTAQQDPNFTSWSRRSGRISTNLLRRPLQSFLASTMAELSKAEDFSLFKKNTSIKQISQDAILIEMN